MSCPTCEGFVLNGPMSSFLVLQVVVFALDIVGRHTCMHITHHNKDHVVNFQQLCFKTEPVLIAGSCSCSNFLWALFFIWKRCVFLMM